MKITHQTAETTGDAAQLSRSRREIEGRRLVMIGSSRATAVAILLAATALPALAGDGVWTAEGLQGDAVYSLAIGKPPRTFFAASASGAFRSTEDQTWTALPGLFPDGIAVDPTSGNTVYAWSLSGLYRSGDNGEHFDRLSSMPVRCLAIDPSAPSTLYAGSGYTWDATTAFAGGVHKSTDGGASWTALNTTSLADGIAALVLDPRRPGTVYAGADVYWDYPGYPPAPVTQKRALIGTVDGGATWTGMLGSGGGGGLVSVPALAVDPDTGTVIAGAYGISSFGSLFRGSLSGPLSRTEIGLGLQVHGINRLVIDPLNPATMYAGTTLAGVYRSLDAGLTWVPMNDGLEDGPFGRAGLWIHSLVLDPEDGVLRAGTANGVFAIRPGVSSAPCAPSSRHLCLLDGRYRATVMAQIPDWQRSQGLQVARGVVVQQGDRFGGFSFPKFTGDSTFPEVVVKVVDPGGDRLWVFHGALTNLPYILSITDTATGRVETYRNDAENRFCGGADVSAFLDEPTSPWDYVLESSATSRAGSQSESLSLLHDRFSITLTATSPRHQRSDAGTAVKKTDRYGYFSLPGFTGDPALPEVYVKMMDKTHDSGKFWLFYAGLTGLDYTLTVRDIVTGAVRTHESPGDFCGAVRVDAFED